MPESQHRAGLFPALLKHWRRQRGFSQLDLAVAADVSARHISFLETGRSRPSREMVLNLSERLDVPLRDRNRLLLAAGFSPQYRQAGLDEPEMDPVREAIGQILEGHEPYPAFVVDGAWEMLARNRAAGMLVDLLGPELLEPPVNAIRASLHPDGLAPHIVNLGQWRAHLLDRLRRQIQLSGSPQLRTLLEEVEGYPGGEGDGEVAGGAADGSDDGPANEIAVPLILRPLGGEGDGDGAELSFISTISTFGTAVEVTTSELSIESFFPMDEATAAALRR